VEDKSIAPQWELRQLIQRYIEEDRLGDLNTVINEYHPADIADSLEVIPAEQAVTIFNMLPDDVASEVLDETGILLRQELVREVDDERLADLLDELPMDDAAEFLDELPDTTSSKLLSLMEPEEAEEVRELLSYEDETAGRLMTRDVAALRRHWSAGEAVEYLRFLVSADEAETIYFLYVVDRDGRLIGVVPIRALVLAPSSTTIESIMVPEVIKIDVSADQEEIADVVSKYDFVAIPVVDENDYLLGVVTVDDVLDIVEEEATEDFQRLGGSEPLAQPYFAASIPQVVAKRLVWLLPLFVLSILTDTVLSSYETVTNAFISLTWFIPAVIGTGGNAASQTVATIIRAIAIGDVRLVDLGRTISREVAIGLILGLALGAFGFGRALLLGADPGVPLVLSLTIVLIVTWSTGVATLVPIIAQRLKIDPAVVSAPMITTIIDASGLFFYLALGTYILLR
jgi:magnesium transporter